MKKRAIILAVLLIMSINTLVGCGCGKEKDSVSATETTSELQTESTSELVTEAVTEVVSTEATTESSSTEPDTYTPPVDSLGVVQVTPTTCDLDLSKDRCNTGDIQPQAIIATTGEKVYDIPQAAIDWLNSEENAEAQFTYSIQKSVTEIHNTKIIGPSNNYITNDKYVGGVPSHLDNINNLDPTLYPDDSEHRYSNGKGLDDIDGNQYYVNDDGSADLAACVYSGGHESEMSYTSPIYGTYTCYQDSAGHKAWQIDQRGLDLLKVRDWQKSGGQESWLQAIGYRESQNDGFYQAPQ